MSDVDRVMEKVAPMLDAIWAWTRGGPDGSFNKRLATVAAMQFEFSNEEIGNECN